MSPSTPRPPGRHLALVGPTASGKSAVALALAEARSTAGRPTEIVSCDSMQVYRGMDVGTATPTAAEQARVPHHLIDLVDPTEEHNLAAFTQAADEAIDAIEERGASALLVGGTGLYVRGIVDGLVPPPHFPDIAEGLEAEDTDVLTQRLQRLDPTALERIPTGNRRRIVRALEVTLGTGRPFSSHGGAFDSWEATPFVLCGLWPDRDVLTARIAARYDAQMAAGLLDEVRSLHALGSALSRTAAQALGYRELLAHLSGECTVEEALESARVRTRRFAVRQQRWFSRDPRIAWFEPPGPGCAPGELAAAIDVLWEKRAAAGEGSVATVDPDLPGPERRLRRVTTDDRRSGGSSVRPMVGGFAGSTGKVDSTGAVDGSAGKEDTLRLGKYHGLGNDFLVALASENPGLVARPDDARRLCDRRRGIGADGLVLGFDVSGEEGGPDEGADARMVLLNADGSEAEISGNGIRCLGQALLRATGRNEGTVVVDTAGGRRELRVVRGDPDDEIWIDVDMGAAGPGPGLTADSERYPAQRAATVDVGNPHLVLLVDDPARIDLAGDGSSLEAGYPEGINVHFVSVDGEQHLVLRPWERGAGATEACGSGASAAVAAASDWGLVTGRVVVDMPGGTAEVEVVDGSVHLSGPSTHVGEVVA